MPETRLQSREKRRKNHSLNESRLATLPHDVLIAVLQYFDTRTLLTCISLTCFLFRNLSRDPRVWNNFKLSRFQSTVRDSNVITLCRQWGRLVELDLSMCRHISDRALACIGRSCPNLRYLDMRGCTQFSERTVCTLLKKCTLLLSLDVSLCRQLTDLTLRAVSEHCPHLQKIDITRLSSVTDEGITYLSRCSKLFCLSMAYCDNITDAAMEALAQGCPNLKALDVFACSKLTDVSIYALGRCREMSGLFLGSYPHQRFTDAAILSLPTAFPDLKLLSLGHCCSWSSEVVVSLLTQLPGLESIVLANGVNITNNVVLEVAKKCPNLSFLGLLHCSLITDEALVALSEHAHNLTLLHLVMCPLVTETSVDLLQNRDNPVDVEIEDCELITGPIESDTDEELE
eukprot:TRINITY_DN4813_c0_g1_i1.p1 TRINITY_DN4813_c0_g1~~TRINITY_DN4813_c0_g1_i1.p1  ORF type:complete len:401 (+),score=5.21 TRINITY_DN4813_c0_g1_i1:118-1320(+)